MLIIHGHTLQPKVYLVKSTVTTYVRNKDYYFGEAIKTGKPCHTL